MSDVVKLPEFEKSQTPPLRKPLSVGSLRIPDPVLLAPMAGYTDSCFRRIARTYGAGIVFTEMISAAGLVRRSPKTLALLAFDEREQPLGIQVFGADPYEMAEAARIAQDHGASLIDLNMGCPVEKVCRIGAGASLLRSPDRAARIVAAVRKAVSCPLTVKIRLGWDSSSMTALQIAEIAESCGADAVTLHPRLRSQGFAGPADWSWVARLKAERKIPIVGNGDVASAPRALEVLSRGVCDAVMIGRASRGNPWLFSQIRALLQGEVQAQPSSAERYTVMEEHLEALLNRYAPDLAAQRVRLLFPHYLKGLPGAATFRRALGNFKPGRTRELLDLLRAILEAV